MRDSTDSQSVQLGTLTCQPRDMLVTDLGTYQSRVRSPTEYCISCSKNQNLVSTFDLASVDIEMPSDIRGLRNLC